MGNKSSHAYINRGTGDVVANPLAEASPMHNAPPKQLEPIATSKLAY